jgi:RND family efflux transporter MFP subunit
VGGIAAFALAVAAGCGGGGAARDENAGPAAILVSPQNVVFAESRRLESGVPFTGELVSTEVVDLLARFDGDIETVLVKEGERVRSGQPLALFRARDVRDELSAAQADVAAARAAIAVAQNNERRARRLLDAGAAAPRELEAAEAQLAAAQAQLAAAGARANRAQEDVGRLDVPSPMAGMVSRVHVHTGERAMAGDPIVTVVATDTLELTARLPADALGRVQPGAPIRFEVDGFPDRSFEDAIERINPSTEPGTRQVRFYARIPNTDGRLVSGLFARGRVITGVRDDATAAPLAALRQEGSDQVVYRLRGGVAGRVPVQIGLTDEVAEVAELIGPLAPGDTLLTGVLPGIRDGAPVKILEGKGSTGAVSGTGSPRPAGAGDAQPADGGAPSASRNVATSTR